MVKDRSDKRGNPLLGYSFQTAAWDLLYAPFNRQDSSVLVTPVVEYQLEQEIADSITYNNKLP